MNKAELIEAIAHETGHTKAITGSVLNAFIDIAIQQVAKGSAVTLVGFGTFENVHRKERTARNPRTGKAITIPAQQVPKFRAGKRFKDSLN